jgi:hypothetical protein
MDLKYLLKIFIIGFLILSVIIFINSIGLNLNDPKQQKVLVGSVTIEGLQNNEPSIVPGNKAFCQTNTGFNQESSCNKLTNYNCNLTSCCIWTSDNKCKAGNQSGPLFNTNSNGKTMSLNHYYYQNKCYGNGCP